MPSPQHPGSRTRGGVRPTGLTGPMGAVFVLASLLQPPLVAAAAGIAPEGNVPARPLPRTTGVLSTASMSDYLGEDAVVLTGAALDSLDGGTSLAVDRNGVLYAAASRHDGISLAIEIERSLDDGATWTSMWTLATGASSMDYLHPVLRVAHELDGTPTRFFCGYLEINHLLGTRVVVVTYVDLFGPNPVWETRRLTGLGGNVTAFDLIATDRYEDPYAVLVAASRPSSVAPEGIRISRSADQGNTWGMSYSVTVASTGYEYVGPRLAVGAGSILHCAWSRYPSVGGPGGNVETLYSRALNFASGGAADWQGVFGISSLYNGADEYLSGIAAGQSSDNVLISMDYGTTPGFVDRTRIRRSPDRGATWSYADSASVPGVVFTSLVDRVNGAFALAGFDIPSGRIAFSEAGESTPLSWSAPTLVSDAPAYAAGDPLVPFANLAANAAFDDALGFLWPVNRPQGVGIDTLFFDAEWFTEPGFARLEPGFPVWYPWGPSTHPIVADIDGDPELEIVFADWNQDVNAYNPDGTPVDGWPVYMGFMNYCYSVAVGDVDGDGRNEVVAGGIGNVHVFEGDGTEAVGYPVDLGIGAFDVHVAIAPIRNSESVQIVAGGGLKIHVLSFGHDIPGFPITPPAVVRSAPGIGDVDGDGFNDIVVTLPDISQVAAFRHDGTLLFTRSVAPNFPTPAPTLADLDRDGDREVVVSTVIDPTEDGWIYVLDETGADVAPWPKYVPVVSAEVPLVDIAGGPAPELMVDEGSGTLTAFGVDGVAIPSWPHTTEGPTSAPPAVELLDGVGPVVFSGNVGDSVYAWTGSSGEVAGWPRSIGYPCWWSPASGDADRDGSVEVVFLTANWLFLFDVGAAPGANPDQHWPMYAYDPAQTHCLNCAIPTTTTGIGGDVVPTATRFLDPPRPNPMAATTRIAFRLEAGMRATVTVHDVAGRLVRTLVRDLDVAGEHEARWDGLDDAGRRVPAGVYTLRLATRGAGGRGAESRKLVVLP